MSLWAGHCAGPRRLRVNAMVTAFREIPSFVEDTCAEISDIQSQQVTGALKIRGWGRGRLE